MRRARRKLGGVLLPLFGPTVLGMLARSWKVERVGIENFEEVLRDEGRLATLWHGRMLLPLVAHRDLGMSVLVSPSEDGGLTTILLKRFGYGVVRGSSNRNPARALRELLGRLKAGSTTVITPDGPRGPRHSVNPGPAWMARATGFPILPSGLVADRAWRLKSWDAFTIPKWGARVVIHYGKPIRIPSEASDEELASATMQIRTSMIALEAEACARLGVERDW